MLPVEFEADSQKGMVSVARRCSYLEVQEVCDGVLSKEASSLEEGAGTICGSTLHKRSGECCKDFMKALLYTLSGSSGSLASGGVVVC